MADFGGLLAKAKAPALAEAPGLKPMPEVEEPEGEGDDIMDRLTPIAQDLLDAIRGGDPGQVAEALMASHRAIAAGPSESSTLELDDEE